MTVIPAYVMVVKLIVKRRLLGCALNRLTPANDQTWQPSAKGPSIVLNKKKKEKIIAKYKTHSSDTGSSPVQIAILTEEIKELTKHLKSHKKDFSSRRGLLKKVAERRRLLNYLRREDEKTYHSLIQDLKLKVLEPKIEGEKEKKLADAIEEVEAETEPEAEPEVEE